jgi:photosynthetic reaction center H subunit
MTAQYQTFFERTTQFDAVELLIWAFLIFFGGLVYWLRREDKREGYPMVDISPVGQPIEGFPKMPEVKVYKRPFKEPTQMPHHYGSSKVSAVRLLRFPGAPLVPVGNPLLAEVGPGAYPLREDEPLLSHGTPQVVPLRVARDWSVAAGDCDPRGFPVLDSRRTPVGTVSELWVDRSVKILRYLEVTLTIPEAPGRRVLVPIYYTDINGRRQRMVVRCLLAYQFADVPGLAAPDQITAREEDRISTYYASGLIFSRGNDAGLPTPRGATEAG